MEIKRKMFANLILFHHLIYMLRRCKNAQFMIVCITKTVVVKLQERNF